MALAPLVTGDQVLDRLGRPFTAAENARIGALIADVSASIRSPSGTGQQITEVADDTQLVRVTRNDTAILPQRPVTAVSTVLDELYDNTIAFTWSAGEPQVDLDSSWFLNAWELNLRQTGRHRNVRVTYDHGYAVVPDDIVAIGCSIVIRALSQSPEDTGMIQESIAGYAYTLRANTPHGPFGITEDERKLLDYYRVPAGAISLMS